MSDERSPADPNATVPRAPAGSPSTARPGSTDRPADPNATLARVAADPNATGDLASRSSFGSLVHEAAMRFDRAWRDVVLPDLTAFLPPDGPARAAVALELAVVDVERRRTAGIAARADEYLEAFPELADDPAAVEELRRAEARPIDGAAAGRYVVLREHAKGGMGRVSVAVDTELGREVAFKDMHSQFANDPGSRRRFVLEAEVTGRLEHPGIVPVYGLGVAPDGRPYYAMRFVRGDSLQARLRQYHRADVKPSAGERAVAFRGLLKRFVDVCNAIAFAHDKGYVHRDIKPANVMLGPFGETLVVDWGLAKQMDSGRGGRGGAAEDPDDGLTQLGRALGTPAYMAPEQDGLTQLGRALGTPAYMAPEQARGEHDRTGPAADVYSLGATLYELLVGKAPFGGKSIPDVLAQVIAGTFPAPRAVSARVPKALEAVRLKAMALNPADRYASALDLAAEVDRWLADEPVQAYREPLRERARRWTRRNRVLVNSLIALVVIGTLAGGTAFGLVYYEQRKTAEAERLRLRALESEAQSLRREDETNKAALATERAAVNRARAALDLTTDTAVERLLAARPALPLREDAQAPQLAPKETEFLTQVATTYEEFAAEKAQNRERQLLAASAKFRSARIRERLGQMDRAASAYAAAIAAYSAIADLAQNSEDVRNLAAALGGNARTRVRSDPKASIELMRKALLVREALQKEAPEDPVRQTELVAALLDAAELAFTFELFDTAEKHYMQISRFFPLVYQNRLGVDAIEGVGKAFANLARIREGKKPLDHVAVLDLHDRSIDLFRRLEAAQPDEPRYRSLRLNTETGRGVALFRQGNTNEAADLFKETTTGFRALVDRYPAVRDYRHGFVRALRGFADLSANTGNNDDAVAALSEARASLAVLARNFSDAGDYRKQLIRVTRELARLKDELGAAEDAKKLRDEANKLEGKSK